MPPSGKKRTSLYWLRFFLAQDPPLSVAGKRRLKGAIATLESDGVGIDALCRLVKGRKNFPDEPQSTILSNYPTADQRRIKALPKNLRAIASILKKEGFDRFLRWGAQRCPGLIETLNYLSCKDEGMFPMRGASNRGDQSLELAKLRRGDLFLKLPEILEDVAQAIENTLQRLPQPVTFAMRITYIVGKIEAESLSKRAHYREILDILDPERRSPLNYDSLKNLVARQRARQKTRSRQPSHEKQ